MLAIIDGFEAWLAADECKIKDQDTGEIIPLRPNRMQERVIRAWRKQAEADKPIRCIILKARKAGISTLIQAFFFYCDSKLANMVACTIAHTAISVESIFRITRRISDNAEESIYPTTKQLRFTDNQSLYYCSWAGGNSIISGDTVNFLHASEAAKWPFPQGLENATSAINAVPLSPLTAIIFESTAKGRDPLFWHRWEESQKPDSPYEPIFIPWFMDDRLRRPAPEGFARTEDECVIARRALEWGIELPDDAFQWRRDKISELTSLSLFKQEFPSTPEEAVQASDGLVYPDFERCIVDALPFDASTAKRCGGIDFGHTHPTAIIDAVAIKDELWVTKVWRKAASLHSEHVANMTDQTDYYADPSAAQAILECNALLNRKAFRSRITGCPRHKAVEDGKIVNSEVWTVRRMLAEGRLKVLVEAADQLRAEADNLFWDTEKDKPDNAYRQDVGHYDTLDALRYLCVAVEAGALTRYEGRSGGRRESTRLSSCL